MYPGLPHGLSVREKNREQNTWQNVLSPSQHSITVNVKRYPLEEFVHSLLICFVCEGHRLH